jgi:hypothetical protein
LGEIVKPVQSPHPPEDELVVPDEEDAVVPPEELAPPLDELAWVLPDALQLAAKANTRPARGNKPGDRGLRAGIDWLKSREGGIRAGIVRHKPGDWALCADAQGHETRDEEV